MTHCGRKSRVPVLGVPSPYTLALVRRYQGSPPGPVPPRGASQNVDTGLMIRSGLGLATYCGFRLINMSFLLLTSVRVCRGQRRGLRHSIQSVHVEVCMYGQDQGQGLGVSFDLHNAAHYRHRCISMTSRRPWTQAMDPAPF